MSTKQCYMSDTQLDELRNLRKAHKLTFNALGALTGYHYLHLVKVFAGSRPLTQRAYKMIKMALSECKDKESSCQA